MTCSATSPLIWNAVPVFADIEPDYYCIDPLSIEERLTPMTKAIIVVSLFGQPYDPKINEIAKKHDLIVIEDAAQAIGSYIEGENQERKYAGTLGDIGVYSFNYGKHITCGEGGIIVTDNDELALRCKLIRNHAEAVIHGMPEELRTKISSHNMIGFNMRMTEIEAAITFEQLKKLDYFIEKRRENIEKLNDRLRNIPAITISPVRPNCTHTYYVSSYQWDKEKAEGIHRDKFIEAVKAELAPRYGREGEGVPIGCGYIEPLYLMPLFQERKLYKDADTFPFSRRTYKKGLCPVCEDLSYDKLFLTLYHAPNSNPSDMLDVADAFEKVWENKRELLNE
jgi:dTDP-4-amino-4,6-dideoxygalactose transaminase